MRFWRKKKLKPEAEGFAFCSHCGALWDERHERGECGVASATARILDAPEPEPDRVRAHRSVQGPVTSGRDQ